MLKRRITIATAQRRTLQKEVGPQGMAVELYHAHQAKYKIASLHLRSRKRFRRGRIKHIHAFGEREVGNDRWREKCSICGFVREFEERCE